MATVTYTPGGGGGGGSEAKKQGRVPKIDLQLQAPLMNVMFFLRTNFLMLVGGGVGRSGGGPQDAIPPPPPPWGLMVNRDLPSSARWQRPGAQRERPRRRWDFRRLEGWGNGCQISDWWLENRVLSQGCAPCLAYPVGGGGGYFQSPE